MLEETGLPYEPHRVSFDTHDQMSPEFLSLNPNNKIPAIIDPNGPGGQPLPLFESGAILIYLADKTGRFLPRDPAARYDAIQWLMFQMGGIGPMFGQVGFFNKFAGKNYEDKRPRDRYVAEAKRLLRVLDNQLGKQAWIAGEEYTIADIATFPWVRNLIGFYEAGGSGRHRRLPQRDARPGGIPRAPGGRERVGDSQERLTRERPDPDGARHHLGCRQEHAGRRALSRAAAPRRSRRAVQAAEHGAEQRGRRSTAAKSAAPRRCRRRQRASCPRAI